MKRPLLRAWPYVRSYALDALIVIAAIAAFVELLDKRDEFDIDDPYGAKVWQIALASFGLTLPLLARRRYPFAAPSIGMLIATAVSFLDGRIVPSSGFLFMSGMAVAAVFGHVANRRLALAGLAVAIAGVTTIELNEPHGVLDELVFLWIVFGVFWVAGFSLKQQSLKVEQARQTAARAVADERARIARELHDVVAHSVSVMTVQAGGVRRLLRDDQAREREALETIERTGREALAEMRRMVDVLKRPEEAPALAPQPSLEHLDRLVRQVRESGLPVELEVEGDAAPLPAGIDLTAYRLVQEGLTNALKHARATRADVRVRYTPDAVELVVRDNGRGSANGASPGHGLVGMRERVAVYGGELEAGPVAGGGYQLRARLPITRS